MKTIRETQALKEDFVEGSEKMGNKIMNDLLKKFSVMIYYL